MEISVGPENLSALLASNKITSVPNFQRNYSWGTVEIDTYLQDLFAALQENDARHFFGPIVVLNKDNQRLLVDGQQRITTGVMSLAILRDYTYVELGDDTKVKMPTGLEMDLKYVRNVLFDPADFSKPKFRSNYQLDELFFKGVLVDPSDASRITFTKNGAGLSVADVRATRELRAAYLRLKQMIYRWLNTGQIEDANKASGDLEERKARVLRLHAMLTNGFEIYSMVLSNEEDAFILFETLNERGLKLSPADLLKTLIMREVLEQHGEAKLEKVLKDWDTTNENVGDYPYSKFLRHHLLTKSNDPVQMRRVFAIFKSRVVGKSPDTPLVELEELKKSSANYKILLETTLYARLNAFSETHRVLLLGLFNKVTDEDLRKKLARATEFLAFRWITCGWNAQILESKYQDLCHRYENLMTDVGLDSFLSEIYASAPNDIDFKRSLETLESEPLQKYLLRRVEAGLGGQHAWDANFTLEHLAPQSPAENSTWFDKFPDIMVDEVAIGYSKQISALGNMSLLEKGLNSAIQNYEWSIKVGGQSDEDGYKGLNASSAKLNLALVSTPDWNAATLEARQAYLVAAALKAFSTDWVKTGKLTLAPFIA